MFSIHCVDIKCLILSNKTQWFVVPGNDALVTACSLYEVSKYEGRLKGFRTCIFAVETVKVGRGVIGHV